MAAAAGESADPPCEVVDEAPVTAAALTQEAEPAPSAAEPAADGAQPKGEDAAAVDPETNNAAEAPAAAKPAVDPNAGSHKTDTAGRAVRLPDASDGAGEAPATARDASSRSSQRKEGSAPAAEEGRHRRKTGFWTRPPKSYSAVHPDRRTLERNAAHHRRRMRSIQKGGKRSVSPGSPPRLSAASNEPPPKPEQSHHQQQQQHGPADAATTTAASAATAAGTAGATSSLPALASNRVRRFMASLRIDEENAAMAGRLFAVRSSVVPARRLAELELQRVGYVRNLETVRRPVPPRLPPARAPWNDDAHAVDAIAPLAPMRDAETGALVLVSTAVPHVPAPHAPMQRLAVLAGPPISHYRHRLHGQRGDAARGEGSGSGGEAEGGSHHHNGKNSPGGELGGTPGRSAPAVSAGGGVPTRVIEVSFLAMRPPLTKVSLADAILRMPKAPPQPAKAAPQSQPQQAASDAERCKDQRKRGQPRGGGGSETGDASDSAQGDASVANDAQTVEEAYFGKSAAAAGAAPAKRAKPRGHRRRYPVPPPLSHPPVQLIAAESKDTPPRVPHAACGACAEKESPTRTRSDTSPTKAASPPLPKVTEKPPRAETPPPKAVTPPPKAATPPPAEETTSERTKPETPPPVEADATTEEATTAAPAEAEAPAAAAATPPPAEEHKEEKEETPPKAPTPPPATAAAPAPAATADDAPPVGAAEADAPVAMTAASEPAADADVEAPPA